ncbi:hypothetical protein V5O48_014366 [Marasmius crinis-equi]|uniref:CxC2-like cysteine cluster KDZ transposase-associated domain-containing protein n=1 Tax=Marasmius crinis-equi TaxID=585013 RepID=A0ABR3EXI3_9AGAR
MPPIQRTAGGSRKVTKGYGNSGMTVGITKQEYNISKTVEELQMENKRLRAMFVALNFDGRAHFQSSTDSPFYDGDDGYKDEDHYFPTDAAPPPGQEGIMHSNGRGDMFEDLFTDMMYHSKKRADDRTRHDRTEKQTQSWTRQHEALVGAYMLFRPNGAPNPISAEASDRDFEIITYSIYGRSNEIFEHPHNSHSINESLVSLGYLGGAPEQPAVAFELSTLEVYRQLHRVCPSLSVEAFSRVLQHMSGEPRHTHLEDQLRIAYDEFLAIKRSIDSRCAQALARDSDSYFVQNICPPCTYELVGEIALFPRILLAVDGNNSLKMVNSDHKRGEARTDTRSLSDPRWLEPEEVDLFKDEVQNAQCGSTKHDIRLNFRLRSDPAWLNVNETEDLRQCIDVCVDRWKAAAPDAQKRMWSFFAVTGIFVAVCRHGHLYVVCDMVKSGELMKYPLAVVNKILERYGKDLAIGYDIMCAFYKTMQRSGKLGHKVAALCLQGVVPAFHGHAHNRKCQLFWHPMYIPGLGLTDFEEWHFAYNQYREALRRLAGLIPLFNKHCQQLQLTPEACEQLLNDKREHFVRDIVEEPGLAMRLDYAKLLTKLQAQEVVASEFWAIYDKITKDCRGYSSTDINRACARKNSARKRAAAIEKEVSDFEIDNAIPSRWKLDGPEYRAAVKNMNGRVYRRALERLERLVVQRLLELTKLNMSNTGYKQRVKISQALTSRAEAIKKAIGKYNKAADLLTPAHEHIDWAKIVQMVSLADFDLLKHPDLNLGELTWAQERYREVMHEHFQILRAQEEITRLNAERSASECGDATLAWELQWRRSNLLRIHTDVAERLVQTSRLKGFTGDLCPGRRIGRDSTITDNAPLPTWAVSVVRLQRIDERLMRRDMAVSPDPESSDSDSDLDLNSISSDIEGSDDRADRAGRLISLLEKWSVS